MAAAPSRSGNSLTARAAGNAIAFEVPRVVDPIHTYGEPDIAINSKDALAGFNYVTQPSDQTTGNVAVSGPAGTGVQRSVWEASVDGGHTFRTIARNPLNLPIPALPPNQVAPFVAPGGGDTEIKYDHTGKQYFADLWALACQHTATRTTDAGGVEHVAEAPGGGCNNAKNQGSDRQWILVKDGNLAPVPEFASSTSSAAAPLTYMEYNDLTGAQWMSSTDGLTYANAQADGAGAGAAGPTGYNPFGADGVPSIDQQTGKVFEASFGGSATTLKLNIGTPLSAAGDLCFLDAPATSTVCDHTHTLVTVSPGRHNDSGATASFVGTSIDMNRNLWVAWVDSSSIPSQDQTYVAVAAPPWTTFSPAIQVSSPPSRVGIFPWIQAGAGGIADVVWYGSDVTADPSTKANQKWDVYLSQVVMPLGQNGFVGPGGSYTPTSIQQVKVTPHPMKYNDICLAGTGCIAQTGNRNLADFFEIHTDRTGAAMIVYNDASNPYSELALSGIEGLSHFGAPIVTIARQSSGPGLLGTDVTGPSNAPVPGLADAANDALLPYFGSAKTNRSGFDILDNHIGTAGRTMTITTKVVDLSNPSATSIDACEIPSCLLEYVTRWQMGNHVYYGMMENSAANQPQFYAGEATVVDDCSVSACDPHIMLYPELPPNGNSETGHVDCPTTPSVATPCTITETINLSDIGNPDNNSKLEEVGSYAFFSNLPMSSIGQVSDRFDLVPQEVDGVCCYNFGVSGTVPPPAVPGPTTGTTNLPNTGAAIPTFGVLLIVLVAAPLALDAWTRRRRFSAAR
ncbi:MAG: hypothetical protein WAT58_03235 [Candidatus Dormiibacterota bacterium]